MIQAFHLHSIIKDSTTLAEWTLPQYFYLLAALTQHDSKKAKSLDFSDTRLDYFFFSKSSFKMPTELQSQETDLGSEKQAIAERGFNMNKMYLRLIRMRKV